MPWWNRPQTLFDMSTTELRKQDKLLDIDVRKLQRRLDGVLADKQKLFQQGAKEKSPEGRRMLAQQFEMKTAEQLMLGRQMNIRMKEKMTIQRLSLCRESRAHTRAEGFRISAKDIAKIQGLIENDAVRSDLYQQQLDDILSIGHEVDEAAILGISAGSQQVMDVWEQMDTGLIQDEQEAFGEADKRVREKQKADE